MRPNRRKPLEVYWLQPALMVLYLVLGVLTAITHHLYYFSLHHGRVYMGSRQQWPIRIGSALTFLSTAFFNMAIVAAYTQYLWTKLRNKTFSLLGIDRLFALTSDATGLCSQEVVRRAKLLALLALFTW